MKRTLFLDFDGTIVDTNKAFCKYYNDFYNHLPNFKVADYNKCSEWSYSDVCPLIKNDAEKIFGEEALFSNLEFFPNAYETLEKLSKLYNLVIVSIGTYANIHHKSKWIEKNLPFIDESILLCKNKDVIMDKSVVNMQDGIFIDDVQSNLDSTNASRKILFGKRFKWNENWKGEHYLNWVEVAENLAYIK